jgi:hypothetical protein
MRRRAAGPNLLRFHQPDSLMVIGTASSLSKLFGLGLSNRGGEANIR